MTVNERIKEVRRALNLSQRAFAKAVYISNGHLAEIELGHQEPTEKLIYLIESCLAVNKTWLLTGEGPMFNTAVDPRMERMAALFSDLYPDFQDFVLRQIEDLLKLQDRPT